MKYSENSFIWRARKSSAERKFGQRKNKSMRKDGKFVSERRSI